MPRNQSTSQILTICQIIKEVNAKNLEATLLFADFSKVFHSIHRGKMEQRNCYCYNDALQNTKAFVCSPDEILQGDTLAPYMFIICLDYEL